MDSHPERVSYGLIGMVVYGWHDGAMCVASDLRFVGHGFESCLGTMHSDRVQATYTYVPLSPSSITGYRSKSGNALRLGK